MKWAAILTGVWNEIKSTISLLLNITYVQFNWNEPFGTAGIVPPTVKQIRQLKEIAASCNRNREQWMLGLCNLEPECAENNLSRWGSYAFQTCNTQGSQFYRMETALACEKFQEIFLHSMRFPPAFRSFSACKRQLNSLFALFMKSKAAWEGPTAKIEGIWIFRIATSSKIPKVFFQKSCARFTWFEKWDLLKSQHLKKKKKDKTKRKELLDVITLVKTRW